MTDDSLSDEDKALFHEHMRAVKPLHGQDKRIKASKPDLPRRVIRKTPSHSRETNDYFLSDFISEPVLSNSNLSYCHPSIPRQRFRELKEGRIPYQGQLDLHGLQVDKARDSLYHFIKAQIEKSRRCVLIIHGKGGHEGAPPVIKNLVNRWLPQFEEVLAFHSALAQDGGSGAVYVLLKKQHLIP